MRTPLLTIVVPTYNRAALLPATIKSLQNQAFRDYEIIIVDDGSTDNTENVIQKYLNEYTKYYKKANAERAAARNYGARFASGLYVNFFDSDDLALANHITEATKLIDLQKNPEWFHLAYEWVDRSGNVKKKINNRKGLTLNQSLATGNHVGCNGVFIRRDIFLDNMFNENRDLSASEDYELWLRLASMFPLYYSNIITSQLVEHDGRSVNTINGSKLIIRLEYLIALIKKNSTVLNYYKSNTRKIYADSYGYISIHLSYSVHWKRKSISYLLKSIIQSPSVILQLRTLAIIRNLLFRWE
jgi:glycosyltransferase involved in cell wall biosynthesis